MTPAVRPPEVYRWQVEDYLLGRSYCGVADSLWRARRAAEDQVKAIGRGLRGIAVSVTDPGGNGANGRPGHAGTVNWVPRPAP